MGFKDESLSCSPVKEVHILHIKIADRTAVISFEQGQGVIVHEDIMDELVQLSCNGFKHFIFDFKGLQINFSSIIAGFLLCLIRKLSEDGARVEIQNIADLDYKMLKLTGLDCFQGVQVKVREE